MRMRGLDATLGCRKIDCISFSLGPYAVADELHHEREAAYSVHDCFEGICFDCPAAAFDGPYESLQHVRVVDTAKMVACGSAKERDWLVIEDARYLIGKARHKE